MIEEKWSDESFTSKVVRMLNTVNELIISLLSQKPTAATFFDACELSNRVTAMTV